jgi:hypothetical protein
VASCYVLCGISQGGSVMHWGVWVQLVWLTVYLLVWGCASGAPSSGSLLSAAGA